MYLRCQLAEESRIDFLIFSIRVLHIVKKMDLISQAYKIKIDSFDHYYVVNGKYDLFWFYFGWAQW